MNSAILPGETFNDTGAGCSSAPAANVANRSRNDRSNVSGGCAELRSSEAMPKYRTAHSMNVMTFSWEITTPFGVPVDPEVNRICAASVRRFRLGGGSAENASQSLNRNNGLSTSESAGSVGSSHPIEKLGVAV